MMASLPSGKADAAAEGGKAQRGEFAGGELNDDGIGAPHFERDGAYDLVAAFLENVRPFFQ